MPEEVKSPEIKEAMEVMFGKDGAKGVVATPPPEPPKELPVEDKAKETPPAPAKAPKPKATPRRNKPATTPPTVDLGERDRIVADAAVRGAALAMKDKGQDATDELSKKVELTPKNREIIEAMTYLGNKDPRYATLAERTLEFIQKTEKEYIEKWQKDHPDEEYDPKDKQHDEFYDKHEPQFDEEALDAARKDMEKEALLAQTRDETDRKLRAERAQTEEIERRKTEAGAVEAAATDAAIEMVKQIVPEADKYFTVDGKVVLTDEAWEKFAEDHPAMADDLRDEAEFLGRKMKELERLNRYQKTYPPDQANALHRAIGQLLIASEDKILELPPAKQVHNRRTFITQAQYGEKYNAIVSNKKATPDQKRESLRQLAGSTWMLSQADMRQLLIDQHVKRSQKIVGKAQKIDERYKKRSTTQPSPATDGKTETAPASTPTPPAPAPVKRVVTVTKAPTSPGADIMPSGNEGGSGSGSALETLRAIGI